MDTTDSLLSVVKELELETMSAGTSRDSGRFSEPPGSCMSDDSNDSYPSAMSSMDKKVVFRDFPKKSLEIMMTYFMHEKLCDIEIEVDDGSIIKAHRVVLAAASPYFRAMFTSGFRDAASQKVCIRGISNITMLQIMKFAYSGSVYILQNNVAELIAASNMLQIVQITEACASYLEAQLDPCNCIGIFKFSEQHCLKRLQSRAENYMYDNFQKVVLCEEFLQIPLLELLYIIRKDELRVKSDALVFEACLRWVKHDLLNRKQYMRSILQVVRGHFSSVEYLEQLITTCPLLQEKPECIEVIKQVARDLMKRRLTYNCPLDKSVQHPSTLYVVGGYHTASLNICEVYNASDGSWTAVANLPVPRSSLAAAFIGHKFYAIGGRVHQRNSEISVIDTPFVHIYDSKANAWTEGPPLISPRTRLSAVVVDKKIYAIGGSNQSTQLSSVERFDPDTNSWREVAPLSGPRTAHGCTVCENKIYIVGGCNGTNKLDKLEMYDPTADEWTELAPMSEPRSGLAAASLGPYVFAVGGCEQSGQVTKVERYDTKKNIWESVGSLNEARSGMALTVMANKIYAIGGFSGTRFLSTMEVYDAETDEWTMCPSLPSPRSGLSCGVPA